MDEDTGEVLLGQQSIPADIRMCSNMMLQNVDLKRAIHSFDYPSILLHGRYTYCLRLYYREFQSVGIGCVCNVTVYLLY